MITSSRGQARQTLTAENVCICRVCKHLQEQMMQLLGHINHRQHHQLTIGRAFGREVGFKIKVYDWPQAFTKLESTTSLTAGDPWVSSLMRWDLDRNAAASLIATFSLLPLHVCTRARQGSYKRSYCCIPRTANLFQSIIQADRQHSRTWPLFSLMAIYCIPHICSCRQNVFQLEVTERTQGMQKLNCSTIYLWEWSI